MAKHTRITYATEEDYKKSNYYSVGPFHRAPAPRKTEASSEADPASGKETRRDDASTNLPDEDQIRLHNLNEKWLREQSRRQQPTIRKPQGKVKEDKKR